MKENLFKSTSEHSNSSGKKKEWVKPTVEVISSDTIENGATTRLHEGVTITVNVHSYHS